MSRKRLDQFQDIIRLCHARYTYVSDAAKYGKVEHWVDCSQDVLNGAAWTGDCEDVACSLASIAINQEHFPPDKCGIAYCTTLDGQGHAVFWMEDEKGKLWFGDCNSPHPQELVTDMWVWKSYMKLSDPTRWLAYDNSN